MLFATTLNDEHKTSINRWPGDRTIDQMAPITVQIVDPTLDARPVQRPQL